MRGLGLNREITNFHMDSDSPVVIELITGFSSFTFLVCLMKILTFPEETLAKLG